MGGASNRGGTQSRGGAGGTTGGTSVGGTSVGGTRGEGGGDTGGRGGALATACEAVGGGSALTCFDIDASAMIADPSRGRLYAVVTGGAAEHANELLVIDPERAVIEASVVVGSDPDSLALSDDATTLWVGLHGALALREVDLTRSPPEPGARYLVPRAEFDVVHATHAGAMVALPGERESLVVALQHDNLSPSGAGVALLDAGVPRANRVDDRPAISVLAAGPPGYLFAVDDQYQLVSIAVDATGLTETRHAGMLPGGASALVYHDGLLFANSGRAFDVTAPDAPRVADSLPARGLIVSHAGDSSVIVLSSTYESGAPPNSIRANNSLALHRVDLRTFEESANVPLDGRYLSVRDFVEPTPGVFAFIDHQLVSFGDPVTVRSAVVLASVPELAESP